MNLTEEARAGLVAIFAHGAGPQGPATPDNWAMVAYRVESIPDLISFVSNLVESYEAELRDYC